jgi:hypothetical protein
MTQANTAFNKASGEPSLSALEYLQKNFGPDEIAATLRVCKVSVLTGGDAGISADIPMGAEIVDVLVQCTKSNGSGSMTVKTAALSPVAISNAIAATTLDTIARAGTIDMTYKFVGADGIAVFANAASDAADVFIYYKK